MYGQTPISSGSLCVGRKAQFKATGANCSTALDSKPCGRKFCPLTDALLTILMVEAQQTPIYHSKDDRASPAPCLFVDVPLYLGADNANLSDARVRSISMTANQVALTNPRCAFLLYTASGWHISYRAFLRQYPYCKRKVWAAWVMDYCYAIVDVYAWSTLGHESWLTRDDRAQLESKET